jgi:hypothetical protein
VIKVVVQHVAIGHVTDTVDFYWTATSVRAF